MPDRKKYIEVLSKTVKTVKEFNEDTPIKISLQCVEDILELLEDQEEVVHPEPSCELTYITDCCCDLCGVQLIREDNFCRCCGKRIEWKGR